MTRNDDAILYFTRLDERGAAPRRATEGSAGFDLCALESGEISGTVTPIRTGLRLIIPRGHFGRIEARSGLALKYGMKIAAGVIDSDYRGEVIILAHCVGGSKGSHYAYAPGERIAQIIIHKIPEMTLTEGEPSAESDVTGGEQDRGSGGFGSTGRF